MLAIGRGPARVSGLGTRLNSLLFTPTDAASVAVFRIGFGLVMLLDALGHLFFVPLDAMFVEPPFMFRYYGFEWVPLLREWIYPLYTLIGLASLGMMLGKFYRLSATVVVLGTVWVFLQDQAHYLNHMYLQILFAALLVVIPAHRYWSLDARARPASASNTLPAWCRLLLVLQIEVILIYAGLVKITPDWLAHQPLGTWLAKRAEMPFFGELFMQDWAVGVAVYGVIGLHLLGAPLLLFKKTRLAVLFVYACFHLLNHFVFDIGVFPWVTWFASLICFDPDWPRQFAAWLRRQPYVPPALQMIAAPAAPLRIAVAVCIMVWLAYQVMMPARNLLYAGDVAWNEQGHRFSWRMKLRSKEGDVVFLLRDPTTQVQEEVNPRPLLRGRQNFKMPCQPDMILQLAHHMRDSLGPEKFGMQDPEVYVMGICSLNYRRPVTLINPTADLAAERRHLGNNSWILPLEVPLSDKRDAFTAVRMESSFARQNRNRGNVRPAQPPP